MTDYTLSDTISHMFTTRSFTTGAPFTLAGSPVISAYPDGSTTQLTAGITLTADFDGVTGLNLVSIVASGANGYAAGKDYNLVITAGTVNGVSVVGEVIGRFTLQRSAAYTDLENATDGLSALKVLIDTIDDFVDTEVAAIKAKTDNLPPDPADASDIAASFASIASTLSTIAAYIDTEVAAIKAKTDSLTFTKALELDVNIQSVNDVTVTGNGSLGTPWGP